MAEGQSVKKITAGSVFSWIFGVLFLLAGVGLLGQGSYIAGIIVILCSAMIIPYFNKFLAEKMHHEISGGIKFVLVIVILIAVGVAVANQPAVKPAATNSLPTSAPAAAAPPVATPPSQAPAAQQYGIGDRVTVGKLQWRIVDVTRQSAIGNDVIGTQANGEFLLLTVEVENVGSSAETLTDNFVKLVDGQGREFSADTKGSIYLGDKALIFEQLNPGVVKNGQVVFDVPAGMKMAYAEVSSTSLLGSPVKVILNQ